MQRNANTATYNEFHSSFIINKEISELFGLYRPLYLMPLMLNILTP